MDWKDWCRLCGDVVVEQSVIKPSDEILQIFEASENYFQIVVSEKYLIFINKRFLQI